MTWPGSWVEREAACSGLSVAGPASQLLKLASADTVLWALGGEASGVPPSPAMEEQDHACDPTWEPPQAKSRPDSPWSWVRARAWPHANPPPPRPAWLRSAGGPCGSLRGLVRPHFFQRTDGTSCSPEAPGMEAAFMEEGLELTREVKAFFFALDGEK